jgi:hypothetical protein
MSTKTQLNLIYSVVLLVAIIIVGYITTIDNDPFGMVGFILLLILIICSMITGIIMLVVVYETKKYWNSILFITSALANFSVFFLLLASLFMLNIAITFMLIFPCIVSVLQIKCILKFNKLDKQKQTD